METDRLNNQPHQIKLNRKGNMNNEEIINAITVLRDVLKAAGLAYQKADEMLDDLKLNPVYPKAEIERAFCGGFLANMKSMADFDGVNILKKFENYDKQFGVHYQLPNSFFDKQPNI